MTPVSRCSALVLALLLAGQATSSADVTQWDPYVAEFYARRAPKSATDSPPPATEFMYGEKIQLVCRFGYLSVGAPDTYKPWKLKFYESDKVSPMYPLAEFPQSTLPPGEPMTLVAKTYFVLEQESPQAPARQHWFACGAATLGVLPEPAALTGNNDQKISVTFFPPPVAARDTAVLRPSSDRSVVPPAAGNPTVAARGPGSGFARLGDLPDLKLAPEVQVGPVKTGWGASIELAADQAQSRKGGICEFPLVFAVKNDVPVGTEDIYQVTLASTIPRTGQSVSQASFQLEPFNAWSTQELKHKIKLRAGTQLVDFKVGVLVSSAGSNAESDVSNNSGQLTINVNGKCDQDYTADQPQATGATMVTTGVAGILNIEGESLVASNKYQLPAKSHDAGYVASSSAPQAGFSGGATLIWNGPVPGAVLDLMLDIPVAGKYAVEIYFVRGQANGTIDVEIAGKQALQGLVLTAPPNTPVGPTQAGTFVLPEGTANLGILVLSRPTTDYLDTVVAIDRIRLYWAGPP